MRQIKTQDWILIFALMAGFAFVYLISSSLETRHRNLVQNLEEDELSLQGEKLKGYAFGFEGLLADWYWVRSLQYIGDKIYKSDTKIDIDNLTPLDPKLLYPLLDNATTLDPQFLAVYSYGATVMPAIDKQHAINIAKKGIENNPKEWRLYHQLGFIYWKIGDYKNAAATYDTGSKIAGAPEWMRSMVGMLNSEGGSRDAARQIYSQLFENATDSQTKASAKLRLMQLDSIDERELLDQSLNKYRAQHGACAANWRQMAPILVKQQLPDNKELRVNRNRDVVDPSDAPYLIDQVTCSTKLDLEKTKLPEN